MTHLDPISECSRTPGHTHTNKPIHTHTQKRACTLYLFSDLGDKEEVGHWMTRVMVRFLSLIITAG